LKNKPKGGGESVTLWKRGHVWWSYVYVKGVRHAKSTGTSNLRIAQKIDRDFKEELTLASLGMRVPQPEMTFGEVTARFLAEASPKPHHLDRLKVLLPYFAEIPIGRINKALVRDYRATRHETKQVSDATINRDFGVLRHLLYWAVDEGYLAANPLARMPLVPERRKPRTMMNVAEEALLLQAAAPHLRPIIIAALDTGMRRGEILSQRWEHIDLTRGLLSVTHSKTAGGEGREIPFTRRLHALLAAQPKSEGLVFTFDDRPIRRIKTAWKTALARAGIRRYRFHDLRHVHNVRLMEAGVMQEVRKALMGHSSGRDVHSIYTHVELPAKREAIRKLDQWVAEQTLKLDEQGGNNDSTKAIGSGSAAIRRSRSVRPETVEKENPGGGRS
jgi:integrase